MSQTADELRKNIINDLNTANASKVDRIYNGLKAALKKFDHDGFLKNAIDELKKFLRTKKKKCLLILEDIFDSKDKLSKEEKEELSKALKEISDIERGFFEDIIRFLGLM